jgi:predicted lipid-binding transport protein (Tim44 family)
VAAVALFAGGLVAVGVLRAQESQAPAQSQPAAPAAQDKAQPPASAPPAGRAPPADAKAPPASRGPAGTGQAQEHFEPTEKIRADFEVSFPVDI